MVVSSIPYLSLRLFLDGMLAMMALYGLLSYLQHRKTIYWQYALYILCMIVTFRLDDREYANANYRPGMNYVVMLFESTALLLYIRFAIQLMDMPRNDPPSYRLLKGMLWLLVGHVVLDTVLWLADTPAMVRSGIYVVNRTSLAIGALIVIPRIIRLRQAVMVYFIIGSFCFVMGCLIALAVNFVPGIYTRELTNALTFPVTYMQVGVMLEVLCFTMGMSLRNRQVELDKISVQTELIRQLQENQRRQHQLERIRGDIARDLHDDIGGDLSSISLLSKAAERQVCQQSDEALATLRLIGESARQVLANMRHIVWRLSETPASGDSFANRLSEVAHSLFAHQDVQLHLDVASFPSESAVPEAVKRAVFLSYKEFLHNALRHARAENIYVKLDLQNNLLSLTVTDDGVGFLAQKETFTGNGLRSLQQRALDIGGQLSIRAQPGEGASLTLACPLTTPVREGVPT